MITYAQQIGRLRRCVEYLKSYNISVHPCGHLSPYAEGGEYEVGSANIYLLGKDNKTYQFIFDDAGEFTAIPDLSKSDGSL